MIFLRYIAIYLGVNIKTRFIPVSNEPVDHPNRTHMKKNVGSDPENGNNALPTPMIDVQANKSRNRYFGNFSRSKPALMKTTISYLHISYALYFVITDTCGMFRGIHTCK